MTRAEYNDIMYAIGTVEEREKELCRDYVKLNPQDKESCERDRDLIRLALDMVRYEIEDRCKQRIKEA